MEVDEAKVLVAFDRLVDAGIVHYDPAEQEVVVRKDGDLHVRVIFLQSWSTKPLTPGTTPAPVPLASSPPERQHRPGSDINNVGFEVADVGPAHFLAMNKYCFVRPQLLLLTQDGFRRQHEPLDAADFAALHASLAALNGSEAADYVVYYNCGVDGGCSRLHKHIQLIPYPKDNLAAFLDREDGVEPDVPFAWFHQRLEKGFEERSPAELLAVYNRLLAQSAAAAGYKAPAQNESGKEMACPHNFIMTRRWMLVLPRRTAVFEGAGANAVGMLGVVAVGKDTERDAWLRQNPRELLRELGFPR